jgi:oligopeptide transport system substrate-binding protein
LDVLGDGFLSLPLEKIPGIIKSDTYKNEFVSVPKLSGYSYLLNTLKPPLNNPLVRRALSLSINRKQLTVIITRCGEQAAKTFTPPSLFDISDIYSEKDFGIDFDPNKAKALLKQAGFPDGKNLPEITFLHSISENHFLIATAIQTFFKHYLNVSLKIEAKDWDEYNDIIFQADRSKAPHITCLRWGSDYPDAYNWLNDAFLYAQGFTFWNNINFNQLVEKASRISNRNKRNNLYKKAEKILVFDEAVIIPLFFETGKYLIKPEIKQSSFTPICGQQLMRWKFGLNK